MTVCVLPLHVFRPYDPRKVSRADGHNSTSQYDVELRCCSSGKQTCSEINSHNIITRDSNCVFVIFLSLSMPTTRSASKKQTSLEDYGVDKSVERDDATKSPTQTPIHKSKAPRSKGTPSKRKTVADSTARPSKRLKTTSDNAVPTKQTQLTDDAADLESPILINRAPVLTLWAAAVASFLYPDVEWATCLSIGSSVSRLCAVSKGRAIGKVQPKDPSTKSEDRKKKKTEAQGDIMELEVMGFPMQIKNGAATVDGKDKPANEHLLRAKFGGEEEYTRVKRVMEEALRTWDDDKETLDKKAFHMYEQFRPSIASGSAGWGRKGPLNMHKVKATIAR